MKNGDVWSHPNKPLENHLIETVRIADEIAKNCGLTLNNNEKNAILLHDIAKAHPSFQKRLRTGRGKFGHAVLSSALVLGLTHDLLCTEAVRRHHGSLQNIPSDVWKFWNEWEWDEDKQRLVSNLSWWPGADVISKMIQMRISSWMELIPSQNDWEDIIISSVDNYGQDPFEEGSTGWLRLRLLYSLLVAADRIEATSGQLFSSKKPTLNYKRFEEHLRGLAQGKLAAWRNKVRQMVIENARLLINKPGVYTLTLPTGAGKTLIGLQIALEAAERLSAVRILYILPYVSLVEQNAGIAAKVFDGVREDHHLAYGKSTHLEEKQDEYTLDDFMSFFRYWHEPVIVTTLAKLWEVLYSPRANDAMSFHSLSNAIVVLDEPQAIPVDCWQALESTMALLADKLNTTFVLMTATQPELSSGQEIVPEPIFFPSVRHRFKWLTEKCTIEEAANFMLEQGALRHSSLFVLNTRRSALAMWAELYKNGLKAYFLSRWVTPHDRRRIIAEIMQRELEREKRSLVSTQVIEAGVDLDFELVFRDLGPLDSIIQVAGRCNRHCNVDLGRVFIAELIEDGKSFSSQVYDSVMIDHTRKLLQEVVEFDETFSAEIVARYYTALKQSKNDSTLWEDILNRRWGEYRSLFNNYEQNEAMLVVDYDGHVKKELEMVMHPTSGQDKFNSLKTRREVFKKLSLQSVPVPRKHLQDWSDRSGAMIWGDGETKIEQVSNDIWIVNQTGIGEIYRNDIGFVPVTFAEQLTS